jgi:PAS domain S-box-containing protein
VLSDITERKRVEQSLTESEAKYRAIFENMAAACCMDEVIYQDGRVVDYRLLDVNPAFERITGIPRSRAVGALASALYGMGQAPFLDVYSKVAETGEPASFEAYFAPLQKHLFVTVGSPGPGEFSTVFSDVTEIARAHEALRDSEARFRLLVESSPDAIFVQTERRFAYLNEAVVRLFGAETADDLLGQPVLDRFHPDFRDNVRERIRQLNELKLPVARAEEVYLRMDGTSVPVEVSARPIHFQGSDGALVFVRDITARKQAEAKLAEQVADLKRWHDVTLGREGRVMELKKELNELLSQAGQPPRYRSVLDEPVDNV